MFTEHSLRDYPSLVKAFMGITAEQFWELIQQMTERYTSYLQQQRQRPDRQRMVGAGRSYDLSLPVRTAVVLTYMRLQIPQATVAALFGATQADVARDLRRLLPLIQQCLPCPVVWEIVDDQQPVSPEQRLALAQLADRRVLIDATEQRVARPHDTARQQAYYSGKQRACTLKTHIVTDGQHHIAAISIVVPGAAHDKSLSDRAQTLAHLPDGGAANADKGYQVSIAARECTTTASHIAPSIVSQDVPVPSWSATMYHPLTHLRRTPCSLVEQADA